MGTITINSASVGIVNPLEIAEGNCTDGATTAFMDVWVTDPTLPITVGVTVLYTDVGLTMPFEGDPFVTYVIQLNSVLDENFEYYVSGVGLVSQEFSCPPDLGLMIQSVRDGATSGGYIGDVNITGGEAGEVIGLQILADFKVGTEVEGINFPSFTLMDPITQFNTDTLASVTLDGSGNATSLYQSYFAGKKGLEVQVAIVNRSTFPTNPNPTSPQNITTIVI